MPSEWRFGVTPASLRRAPKGGEVPPPGQRGTGAAVTSWPGGDRARCPPQAWGVEGVLAPSGCRWYLKGWGGLLLPHGHGAGRGEGDGADLPDRN